MLMLQPCPKALECKPNHRLAALPTQTHTLHTHSRPLATEKCVDFSVVLIKGIETDAAVQASGLCQTRHDSRETG